MAQFNRVSGDAGAVANYDVANYVNGAPVGTGVTINPQGPSLTYLAVYFGADLVDGDFGVGGPVEAVISVLQQVGVVATYEAAAIQLNTTAADVQRCSKFALYPTGLSAATITALEAQIQAIGTVANGYDLSTAEVIASSFGA